MSTGHNLQSPWEENLQEGLSKPGWSCLRGTVLIKLIDGTHSGQHHPLCMWSEGDGPDLYKNGENEQSINRQALISVFALIVPQ